MQVTGTAGCRNPASEAREPLSNNRAASVVPVGYCDGDYTQLLQRHAHDAEVNHQCGNDELLPMAFLNLHQTTSGLWCRSH